jgi:hypothetical protein
MTCVRAPSFGPISHAATAYAMFCDESFLHRACKGTKKLMISIRRSIFSFAQLCIETGVSNSLRMHGLSVCIATYIGPAPALAST